jgi:hypothetical protein
MSTVATVPLCDIKSLKAVVGYSSSPFCMTLEAEYCIKAARIKQDSKMAVFWDVVPYSLVLTDVSEVLTASVIAFHRTAWRNVPE